MAFRGWGAARCRCTGVLATESGISSAAFIRARSRFALPTDRFTSCRRRLPPRCCVRWAGSAKGNARAHPDEFGYNWGMVARNLLASAWLALSLIAVAAAEPPRTD